VLRLVAAFAVSPDEAKAVTSHRTPKNKLDAPDVIPYKATA